MRVGVCRACKALLVTKNAKSTADKILDNHREYFSETGIDATSWTVVDPNTNEEKFVSKKISAQKKEDDARNEQIKKFSVKK